ncbi:Hsp20/alpha crystallin family protein [Cytobacillus sp. FJAT-54145]|uniref:Hsp20/alpha crystallin family protein n=1 Tax=Cytobacillus spartinae TaxID=3299023 RepID=A0ABW6KCT6_9BACI
MDMEKILEYIEQTKKNQHESFWNQFIDNVYSSKKDSNQVAHQFFKQQDLFPKCDLYEYDNKIIIEAEVPGVHKSDIHVSMQNNTIIIKGQCKTLQPQIQYYLKERQNRTFEKSIAIPVNTDKKGIRTSLKDGILTISLPMIEQEDRVPISINTNDQ